MAAKTEVKIPFSMYYYYYILSPLNVLSCGSMAELLPSIPDFLPPLK